LLFAGLVAVAAVAIPSLANLPGSTFEGNDGNLVVNTPGNTDWANAPNRVAGVDLASGGTDNAFGQGTKEDDANVSVVTGSIPPQKSDLTRFYAGSEFASNNNYLYLAWERSNVLGSANMDFEINKLAQPNLTTTGQKTLNRSPGDLLVTFDFTNGGGNPVLGLLKWLTTGSADNCFSANALPCWGANPTDDALDGQDDERIDLSAAGFAEGAVNAVSVTDPIPPNAPRTLPALTFGEAAINLTAAGVFPPGTCTSLGSAFLKSRSSAAFPAEVKDFVAPQPVNISNCGQVKIIKRTSPRGVNQNFDFTSANSVLSGTCTTDTTPAAFTLNDNGNTNSDSSANTESCTGVPAGTYTVTEGANPTGFAFVSVTCTDPDSGTTTAGKVATIDVDPNELVTCVYVNQQQLGAIKITKTSSKSATGLSGATFSITKNALPISGSPFTTGANGTVCVDGLTFGDYVVTETAAPTGYAIDDGTAHTVTVDNNAACSDATYIGESSSFTDTPLADIQVRFRDGGSGETALAESPMTCTNTTGTSSDADTTGWDDTHTVTGVKVGSTQVDITCTIKIDP